MERPDPAAIPETPGVYIYKDSGGRIIYVGKARCLRRRVLSYFRPASALTAKTAAMIGHAAAVEFLTTTTEKDALLLEASLIKKHRPHYNITLRDDKQYIMFRIADKEPFPRLEIVRRMKRRDGAHYFGPYTSGLAARQTWKAIHRIFPLRRCSLRAMKNRAAPCLYHHIHLCSAPCTGQISREDYDRLVKSVCMLLSGRSTELMDSLRLDMERAAEALDFEAAAALRDQIRAVQKTVEAQGIVLRSGDMDALGLVDLPAGLALGIVFVRNGLVQDRSAFYWPGLGMEEASELLVSFIIQFYHGGRSIPPRILLPFLPWEGDMDGLPRAVDSQSALIAPGSSAPMDSPFMEGASSAFCTRDKDLSAPAGSSPCTMDTSPPQQPENAGWEESGDGNSGEGSREAVEALLSELRGGTVRIVAPQADEDLRLLDMARSNAREAALKKNGPSIGEKLAAAFRHGHPVDRVECADVSHTSGECTKVGVVAYEGGQPVRSDYRIWNIEGAGGDDYAALRLWAQKRLEHGGPWPDLLLIDGGRGQLNAVERALRSSLADGPEGSLPFLLAGIAKARNERGMADRRAGNVADRIFVPGRSNPLPLHDGCPELLFLQIVRDAAHDFSIGRHRRARERQAFSGELSRMPGIGMHTAKLLWEHFDSVRDMKAAAVEDLMKLPGIGRKKAELIADSLKKL